MMGCGVFVSFESSGIVEWGVRERRKRMQKGAVGGRFGGVAGNLSVNNF